jgi:hypothetical protein
MRVAAAKERLLHGFPGQFCDGVGDRGSEDRYRSGLPIGDDRQGVQEYLVTEQKYRAVNDINAIGNTAKVAEKS